MKKKGQQQAETAACGEIRKTFKEIASSSVFLGGQNAVEKVVRDWAYLAATNMTEKNVTTRVYKLPDSITPALNRSKMVKHTNKRKQSKTTLLLKERLH